MTYKIQGEKVVTVGTSAVDVDISCWACIIKNDSENTVYFRDRENGNASEASSMCVRAGETFPFAVTCKTLSLVASAASSKVRLLFTSEA